MNENALIQDGPPATFGTDGVTRLGVYDTATGAAIGEYVYLADAPAEPSNPPTATAFTGNVEMMSFDDDSYLVMERTSARRSTAPCLMRPASSSASQKKSPPRPRSASSGSASSWWPHGAAKQPDRPPRRDTPRPTPVTGPYTGLAARLLTAVSV
nr:esterase-like activity of phytase family protein [Pacificimonas pallii]